MSSSTDLGAGGVIALRYELVEMLGEGGMGEVWKAFDRNTEQFVAVKHLHPQRLQVSASAVSQTAAFKREMTLIARLKHPNIVRLFDSGVLDDGALFAVMEFIDGRDLSEILEDDGPLSPHEAKRLMMQVLDALCCAHAVGIVHRDIKPANIMVTSTGGRSNAMVLDFGISSMLVNATGGHFKHVTESEGLRGTPSYLPPEFLLGEPVTPSLDVYGWGLVFIEALTGVAAVDGENIAQIVTRQLSPEPVELPAIVQGTPLGAIIAKASSKQAADRYPSALEALWALDEIDALSTSSMPALPTVRRLKGPMPTTDVLAELYQSRNTLRAEDFAQEMSLAAASAEPIGGANRRMVVMIAIAAGIVLIAIGASFLWPSGEGDEVPGSALASPGEPKPEDHPGPAPELGRAGHEVGSPNGETVPKLTHEPTEAAHAAQNALLRGLTANQNHQYADALLAFEVVLTREPRSAELHGQALVGFGLAHQALGNPDAAEAAFRRCVDKYPDSAPALQASQLLEQAERRALAKSAQRRARRTRRKPVGMAIIE